MTEGAAQKFDVNEARLAAKKRMPATYEHSDLWAACGRIDALERVAQAAAAYAPFLPTVIVEAEQPKAALALRAALKDAGYLAEGSDG